MKKYYDDRHQLNMEISDTKDGSMHISYINQLGSKKSRSQKLKAKKSSNLIVLNTTITTVKPVVMFHSKPMTHMAP